MPSRERKVKIDKRFKSMFHDERFKLKYTVDKRGRPVNQTSTEDLKRFYKLSDSEQSDEEEENEQTEKPKKEQKVKKADEEPQDEESGVEEDEEEEADEDDESESGDDSDNGPDLARGKGNIETSSDEEDDDDDDELEECLRHEEEEIEHDWGEMWKDAPRTYFAHCALLWPRETSLPCVFRVYREKVRDYQFKRLRYYYAVVECDSIETAAKIYEECDGYEYESSCSMIDLRFIPDDVTFDDEPKDRATDVDYSSYKPKLFTSTATTTAKVELTWDETDHDRVTALCRKFNKDDLLDMDFKAYLASSSEEEEDEEEAEQQAEGYKEKKSTEQIAKYRELLKSYQDKDKEKDDSMDMEVTWIPGLKETTEKLVKKKMEGKDQLTPWEQYLQKRKEKKKEKRKDLL
uniref:ESF1 homolog n=1 Tax=Sinocyclocheilus grahami TaxID=75366 RepID=A0A672JW46_SINGR